MKMNRVRLLTEFDVGGDIANFYRLSCLYEMHRLTEYPSGSGRRPASSQTCANVKALQKVRKREKKKG